MSVDTTNHYPSQEAEQARVERDTIVGATVESLGEAQHEPSDAKRALGAVVSVEEHTRFSNKKNEGRPRSSTEEVGSPELANIATLIKIIGLVSPEVLAKRLAAADEQFTLAA